MSNNSIEYLKMKMETIEEYLMDLLDTFPPNVHYNGFSISTSLCNILKELYTLRSAIEPAFEVRCACGEKTMLFTPWEYPDNGSLICDCCEEENLEGINASPKPQGLESCVPIRTLKQNQELESKETNHE